MSRTIFWHPLNPCAAINKEKAKPSEIIDFRGFLVRVTRLERAISASQMRRGTSSATPGYSVFAIIPRWGRKSKIFLSVVIPVVRAVFRPGLLTRRYPANTRGARLSGLLLLRPWMEHRTLPNVAPYQLSYTRLFSFELLYHAAGKNQRFSCLWSIMWSKPYFGPVFRPGEIPLTPVLQGFPGLDFSGRGWYKQRSQRHPHFLFLFSSVF